MRENRAIRAADVQRLLGMVIDVCTASASPLQRKQSLIAGLCGTFHARIGEIVEVAEYPDPARRQYVSFADHGWDNPDQSRDYVERCERMNLADPLSERLLPRTEVAFCIRREDIVEDNAWYQSAYINEILRPADLNSVLGCYRRFRITPAPANITGRQHRLITAPKPCDAEFLLEFANDPANHRASHHVSSNGHAPAAADASRMVGIGIGLHRPWSDAPFTARDVALLNHVNHALARLYPYVLFDADEHIWRTLPPRLREVLNHLLEGHSDKAIAERLRLSPHTIHDYAAELYVRFDVEGRTALLAKILGRTTRP